MATQHLDLDEQEQIATIQYFWRRYGKWIAVVLVIVAAIQVGWVAWNNWQSSQAQKSAVLFDELSKAVGAGDVAKTDRVFADMKDQFGATSYTAQAALLAARMNYAKGNVDAAKAPLQWLIDSSADSAYKDVARLRLAGVLLEAKQYDPAIQLLRSGMSKSFESLALDRIGDAYFLQNKMDEAKANYLKAYNALPATNDYRRMIDVKLGRMGVAVKDAP